MTKIKTFLGFLIVALAIGICIGSLPLIANAQTDKDKKEKNQEREDDDNDADEKVSPEEAKQAKISMEEAKAIALKRVDGSILDEELEKENGRLQYAFDIRAADGKIFDVEIDAMTGEVLQVEEDDEDGNNEDNRQSRQTKKKNVFVRTANSVKSVTARAVGKIF